MRTGLGTVWNCTKLSGTARGGASPEWIWSGDMAYGGMAYLWICALVSAWCAGCAVWLRTSPAARLTGRGISTEHRSLEVSTTLVLALFIVALRQGTSIPRACGAVGDAAGGAIGAGLVRVGERLSRGADWHEAWRVAGADEPESDAAHVFRILEESLEPSWTRGVSPIMRLETTLEQYDADERSRIEAASSRLSVRLLIPTALCFLPAFVFIGVIPTVVSLVM